MQMMPFILDKTEQRELQKQISASKKTTKKLCACHDFGMPKSMVAVMKWRRFIGTLHVGV